MRITSLTPITLDLPLANPIKLSDMEIATSENVLVRLEADDGLVGWGEAPTAPTMTGETAARLVAAVDYLAPRVRRSGGAGRGHGWPALWQRERKVRHRGGDVRSGR